MALHSIYNKRSNAEVCGYNKCWFAILGFIISNGNSIDNVAVEHIKSIAWLL